MPLTGLAVRHNDKRYEALKAACSQNRPCTSSFHPRRGHSHRMRKLHPSFPTSDDVTLTPHARHPSPLPQSCRFLSPASLPTALPSLPPTPFNQVCLVPVNHPLPPPTHARVTT